MYNVIEWQYDSELRQFNPSKKTTPYNYTLKVSKPMFPSLILKSTSFKLVNFADIANKS